ncbi:hypothetical protein TNCV_2067701 [Trichonephila clavipes]|uniref:Uncharacterized protein n=1 Tax=Trichonephila clavipes TaxID=2585209 RepID=A0A8X6W375_TRICX|nr:hypothetical protein TNCV_2067701 [Trichonephila clavipes]
MFFKRWYAQLIKTVSYAKPKILIALHIQRRQCIEFGNLASRAVIPTVVYIDPQGSMTTRKVVISSPSIFKAVVTEWYRYRIVACLVTSSSPIPIKTHRVRQRCTLNLSRAEKRHPVGVV